MFRSCQIIIRELSSLLKLCYSIQNSIGICKRGVVAAYHVVEQWLGVRLQDTHLATAPQHIPTQHEAHRATAPQHIPTQHEAHRATAPQHIPTQHDMLPQHLVCKYQLNCEYCNITLARNKAP